MNIILSIHISSFLKEELDHFFTVSSDCKNKRSVSQLKGEIVSLRTTKKVEQVDLGRAALPKVQAYFILSINICTVLK